MVYTEKETREKIKELRDETSRLPAGLNCFIYADLYRNVLELCFLGKYRLAYHIANNVMLDLRSVYSEAFSAAHDVEQ